MGLRLKYQEFGECFFITTSFLDHMPIGNNPGVYEILATGINYQINETGAKIISYVFMSTHIHFVVNKNGKKLSDMMRDFKKYTAQKALLAYCPSKKVWQYRYDRQAILSEDVLLTKIEYIHNNPVKAGLAKYPHDWYWSSASDYIDRNSGPIAVWKDWHY
jgi:putative transposase